MLSEKIPYQFTTVFETEPNFEPVTLTEAKNYLRVDISEDDALINGLITTARKICENLSNRYFHQREIVQKQTGGLEVIDFVRSPVTTVSVMFTETDTAEAFDDFYFTPERLLNNSLGYRFRVGRVGDGYTITYTAGIVADATPSTLSNDLKVAILRILAYLYENRIEGVKSTSEQAFSITFEQSMDIQKILNPISTSRSFF